MLAPLDDITPDRVTVYGQRLMRPPSVPVMEWQRFWRGARPDVARDNFWVGEQIAEPFGLVVSRPRSALDHEWFGFWSQRRTRPINRPVGVRSL